MSEGPLDDRTPVHDLFAQLAAGREKLREERAAIAADRAAADARTTEAERLHREAEATSALARKVAARYLKITRAKVRAERKAVAADRAAADRDRRAAAAEAERAAADRDRLVADAEAYNARLKEAWDRLAEQQQQFAGDRQRTEQELSHLFQLLDARTADAAAREEAARAERHDLETRYADLHAEIAGLEQRAAHTRLALQELEQQRAGQTADSAAAAYFAAATAVVPVGRSPEEVTAAIQTRELESVRERNALVAARTELNKLAEYLTDQRALLAEQFATLAAVQREWHDDGVHTVGELEDLARELHHREELADAREAAVERADAARRERDAGLWKYQTKLEAWQAALAAREAEAAADRDRAEAELAVRRGRLADREAALDAFGETWDGRHAELRDRLVEEVAQWVDDRKACGDAIAECDTKRAEMLAEAERLAAATLAVAEARKELEAGNPRAARRVRVLHKRWAARFARQAKELDARQKSLAAEAAAVERRYTDLRKLLFDATARQQAADAAARADDRARLAALPGDEEPVILSVADAVRGPTDRELEAVRREAEALAAQFLRADEAAGVLRLRAGKRPFLRLRVHSSAR